MKKIPTLFERVFENHKIVGINPIIIEGCKEAFINGVATVKYDGSCCAFIKRELYKRYDAKNGKPIPEGAIKCQDLPDPITGHLPCWVKCDVNNPSDKWFIEAANYVAEGKYKSEYDIYKTEPIIDLATFEAIGKHFNGNPYGLDHDEVIKHGDNIIEVERTFEGIKQYLEENYIEGIVFWFKGEPVCKIKRTDFGFKWGNK